MGYRHYFYKLPKAELEEIKNCKSNAELCDWAKNRGYGLEDYEDDEPYVPIYQIGKEVCGFGKHVDWAFDMQSKNESIFGTENLSESYSHYAPVICTEDDFLLVIEYYKQKIVEYYKSLFETDHEEKVLGITLEQKWKNHISNQLNEWNNDFGLCPLDTDRSRPNINRSWLYEYEIFELVRVYKTFNFENDALILLGW